MVAAAHPGEHRCTRETAAIISTARIISKPLVSPFAHRAEPEPESQSIRETAFLQELFGKDLHRSLPFLKRAGARERAWRTGVGETQP